MTPISRISSAAVADLRHRLSERDLAVINTVDRFRLVSARQLERLHFADGSPLANARVCRRVLRRLVSDRVLVRLARRHGGSQAGSDPWIYALDSAGQRLASLDRSRYRRPWVPGRAYFAHFLEVAELFVTAAEAHRAGAFELIEFAPEPICWRSFVGRGGGRALLKPDAAITIGNGEYEDWYFVEIDRSTESRGAVIRKLAIYEAYWRSGREQRDNGVFPKTLWLVPNEARKQVLIECCVARGVEVQSLFQVGLFDEAMEIFSGGLER